MANLFSGLQGLSLADQVLFSHFGRGKTIHNDTPLVHHAFERIAEQQPSQVAVEYDGNTITYGELEEQANALANRLIRSSLQPRQRVCLVVQRCIPTVVAILAVLKCGCQYIPLDGGVVPDSVLPHILKDTESTFVLCLDRFRDRVEKFAIPGSTIVSVDKACKEPGISSIGRPSVDILPTDGAYVIYTSGSTGFPKGVDVAHRGVSNVLLHSPASLGIKTGSRVGQVLSVSFDMGQWEILGTLLNGGTLIMRTGDWEVALKTIDTLIATPSILGKFTRGDFPNIKTIALGGEPCPRPLADDWSQQAKLYNVCGPTEVSVLNTTHLHTIGDVLSIGMPIPNTNLYILDENEEPVSMGGVGQMWAGGICVSRGYINLPEKTAERWKADKFVNDGSLMFNTGDLGSWRSDGTLIHKGRIDDQVKVKGFRVELDGVSAAIEKTDGVDKGCAILIENVLWGFYSGPSFIKEEAVKDVVTKSLPYYAVPTRWACRRDLPLTPNGKIDKRALIASLKDSVAQENASESGSAHSMSSEVFDNLSLSTAVSSRNGSIDSFGLRPQHEYSEKQLEEVESDEISEQFALPNKKGRHGLRAARHKVFSLYRRFHTAVLVGNVTALILILLASRSQLQQKMATATSVNLLVAVLMRQEHVINFLFGVLCRTPTSWPLSIRRQLAKVYHIGGIHSGCAIASLMWLIASAIIATIESVQAHILVVIYTTVLLLSGMIYTAYPKNRIISHDRFEYVHRFAGWSALALFWAQTILTTESQRGLTTLGGALVRTPGFWLLVLSTISIVAPWLNLRKIPVRAEVLSDHAVRLHFDYATPTAGTGIRLSEDPLMEWHAFATISKPGEKGFSVVVSKAGDWTTKQIQYPPTRLYVKGVPGAGVLRICTLFKSVILVSTGSGIGPCLPVIYKINKGKGPTGGARILWSTPNPEKTFGKEIISDILKADPKAIIHDTKANGRPDIVALTYQLYKELGAEAVCIISNKKVTQMVVYAMESRGIPAYGAIFDS